MVDTTWNTLPKEKKPKPPTFKENLKDKYKITTQEELKEKVRMIKIKNKIRSYAYEEESFGVSIEPKYFWTIDFMKKIGFNVEKHWEKLGASVVSQFFGEMSTRRQFLEKRGMEILLTVNGVIRSILNLLYDLREFDRRLALYNKINSEDKKQNEEGILALKRVWMDEVDQRKGGASLNNLAQKGIEFITIRDAFMVAKTAAEVDGLELNDRVKRILKPRLSEFFDWKTESEKELNMRRSVERTYLATQIKTLKLYSQWAKPYLKAAQRLKFEDVGLKDAQLIQAFDQNYIEIKVRATQEKRLKEIFMKSGIPRSFSVPETWTAERKAKYMNDKFGPAIYGVLETTFKYRTKPTLTAQTQAGGVYRQHGNLQVEFDSYLLTKEEYDLLERQEESEAMEFIEGLTDDSLQSMREDIEKYMLEEEEERKGKKDDKKEKKEHKPLLDYMGDMFGKFEGGTGLNFSNLFGKEKYTQSMGAARAGIAESAFTVYENNLVYDNSSKFVSYVMETLEQRCLK